MCFGHGRVSTQFEGSVSPGDEQKIPGLVGIDGSLSVSCGSAECCGTGEITSTTIITTKTTAAINNFLVKRICSIV